MNCPDCLDILQRRFDGEDVRENANLERHLATCAACRELHAAARRLEEGLRLLTVPAAPPDLAERIYLQVSSERRASRRRLQRMAGYAVAASLVLAVFLFQYLGRQSPVQPPQPANPSPVAEVPPAVPSPVPSLRDGVAEAGTAVVSVAQRMKQETVEQTRLLWPDPMRTPGLPGTEALQQTVMPPAQGLRELEQGVSAGVDPVATGFRRWGSMVLRNLPPLAPEQKQGF